MNRWKEYLHRLDYMPILTQNAPRTREEFSLSVKLCVGVMEESCQHFPRTPSCAGTPSRDDRRSTPEDSVTVLRSLPVWGRVVRVMKGVSRSVWHLFLVQHSLGNVFQLDLTNQPTHSG